MAEKRKITISFTEGKKQESAKQRLEDVTLYGKGAGMYSYLGALARCMTAPGFDRRNIEIRQ